MSSVAIAQKGGPALSRRFRFSFIGTLLLVGYLFFGTAAIPAQAAAGALSLSPGSPSVVRVDNSTGLSGKTRQVPPFITVQPANEIVSVGQTAKFTVRATGTAPLVYQWRRNGADIRDANASSYVTPPATPDDSGAFFDVIVRNNVGTVASKVRTLTVDQAPTPTPTPSPAGDPVTETFMQNEDGSQLQWEMYFPTGPVPPGGWPAVVVVHGGGFHGGGPSSCVEVANDLAAAGYVALAITYRLAPEHVGGGHQLIPGQPDTFRGRKTGTFPDQTDDVANAVHFARNPSPNSLLRGLVNGLVGAVGDSAGASHTAWVATHGSLDDDKVNVGAALSGPYDGSDFDDQWNPAFKVNWLAYVNVPETDLQSLRAASPAWANLTGASPLFMVASYGDPMPPRQLPDMVAALQAAGVRNFQPLTIAGSLHAFEYWNQIDVDGIAIKTKVISFLAAGFASAR